MTAALASDGLVEQIAAAFHTLVRGWHYDPERHTSSSPIADELVLDPWLEPTTDERWLQRGEPTVDIAATWWSDLPSDWQERFTELARQAGSAVVAAAQAGRTPIELVGDDLFLSEVGACLKRDWLSPPRVVALQGGVIDRALAGAELSRVAVHIYARQLVGFESSLGTVPTVLPSQLPDINTLVKVGGERPKDTKHVAFTVCGDNFPRALRARLTQLVGQEPTRSWSRGALNLQRSTGKQYRPRQSGYWSLSSRHHLLQQGPTVEDHILWLLRILEPQQPAICKLMAEFDLTAQFGCCYGQTAFNAEWVLSARTTSRIAALDASFWFDSYYTGDEDDD